MAAGELDVPTSETRLRILAAAVHVLRDRGFAHTRLADVAVEAGVSQGLVIYHFRSRERLLSAALRYSEEQFLLGTWAALVAVEDAGERLDALIQLTFRQSDKRQLPAAWLLWPDLWQLAVRSPEARHDLGELDGRWREAIARVVRDGQKNGRFGSVDPRQFADMLAALCDGLAVTLIVDDSQGRADRAVELCRRLCDSELGPEWRG
jgi:AcrR family transcriptional regulator